MADNSKVEFIPTAGGVFINVERQVTDKVVGFKIVVKKGRSVLYIGDSITDGAWGRSNGGAQPSDKRSLGDQNHIYGHSYVMLCAAHYQSAYPMTDYKFYNRGISGDGIDELVKRWQQDALDLHPDVVSILIGTNDVNAYIGRKQNNPAETFDMTTWEKKYRQLLDQLRSANPLVKIFLGTPFVAKEGNVGKQSDFFLRKQLIHEMGEVVRHIANDYGAVVLPYDEIFESLIVDQPRPGYWIWDGIHPTPADHQKMSELWIHQARNAGVMP